MLGKEGIDNNKITFSVFRVASLALIIIWIRLLKFARASEFLGLLYYNMKLSQVLSPYRTNDSNNWTAIRKYFTIFYHFLCILFSLWYLLSSFLYCSSCLVHVVANFWLLFGGDEQTAANITEPSEELTSVHRIFTMLFRMSLIDDYPYQVCPLVHLLPSICPFILSFIHLFSHSSIYSLIHPFILSFIHSFSHSSIHSLIHPFILPFIHLFSHSSIYSLIHPFILPFIHSFSYLSIYL